MKRIMNFLFELITLVGLVSLFWTFYLTFNLGAFEMAVKMALISCLSFVLSLAYVLRQRNEESNNSY